ncbi:MAG: gamma-glutamylcyclotransferase [Phyllobacteriaceae bacterium]|nr:gamma-glutamylcyclotransferase [Phyllobacteriaceae bacterium]
MPYDLTSLDARDDVVAYFGYGSLVNPHTHRTHVIHCERAHLTGFGRRWQQRSDPARHPVSFLSAYHADLAIDELSGLLIFDHRENLPAVDAREHGYDRVELDRSQLRLDRDDAAGLPDVAYYVYVARPPDEGGPRHHILQSYLDAVLQGYLHQYGELGARRFVESTAAFDTPIVRDRASPLYPRAVKLAPDEVDLIDQVTAGLNHVDGFLAQ